MMTGPDGEPFEWKGEVWKSNAFSSHADQSELIDWVTTKNKLAKVFLLHGEAQAKEALKKKLVESGLPDVLIPSRGMIERLD